MRIRGRRRQASVSQPMMGLKRSAVKASAPREVMTNWPSLEPIWKVEFPASEKFIGM